jgi:hypothetical protein
MATESVLTMDINEAITKAVRKVTGTKRLGAASLGSRELNKLWKAAKAKEAARKKKARK